MKFLCLGYHDASFSELPEEERNEILRKCFAQCVPFRAAGKILIEEMVESPGAAKTIRPKNGKPTVTDGPFIDTKEQLGAFWVIEAENLEAAIAVASLHPGALMGEEYGFGIEVRPFQE
jgi:hypothetical protein